MRGKPLSRRTFLAAAGLGAPLLLLADGFLEPAWVKTRRLRLSPNPTLRLVHLTDIHHRGNARFLRGVIARVNALNPQFVCFTGDLIDERQDLEEALAILAEIRCPLYGVPGNHDYWSKAPFDPIHACFNRTGGRWLLDEQVVTPDGKLTITGASNMKFKNTPLRANPDTRNLCLIHYPAWVKLLPPHKFDLVLAGHSHGGQCRIPFYGPIILPFGVDEYDLGLYSTPAGPLYVGPGIGWYPVPFRFNCRPEITLVEV